LNDKDQRKDKLNPPVEDESSAHMGAKESQVAHKRPPTTELGKLSDSPLEEERRPEADYDPVDEITPG
jgi:hypothetical protein